MTIKSLLLCLFLYVCLVWVGAAYFYSGADIARHGLLWTGMGLIAALGYAIVTRAMEWPRRRRAKTAVHAATPEEAAPTPRPEEEPVRTLAAQANATLAKAPAFAGTGTAAPLFRLPLYLLAGAEGSGKTSAFLNSGLEPQLLAGEGVAPVAPTRTCNIWLAKGAIFAEIGGRLFSGEPGPWNEALTALRARSPVPWWRRLWDGAAPRTNLRGVIAFLDSKELTGAAADPQRLEHCSRDWQERLRSIADRFGTEFPVYFVVSKCDGIRFFSDFFRRLPESQTNEVLGCTLAVPGVEGASANEVFADAEAKRLTASFRPLYHALARQRLSRLAHEPDAAQRPGVYEFPRELKRIRTALVQFLTDVFRPYALGPKPFLRGYYLTGTREAPAGAAAPAGPQTEAAITAAIETTRIFRPADATRMFQPEERPAEAAPGAPLYRRWMFVADLFHRVVLPDRPPRRSHPAEGRIEFYRRLALAGACVLCAVLCGLFLVSWTRNRALLAEVGDAVASQPSRADRATTVADLESLERLRVQIVRLQGHLPWSFHWGLYTGDRMLRTARTAYFRQFLRLLLADLNGLMVADLNGLPRSPDGSAPYEPVYRTLKTHLMITSGACKAEPELISRQLRELRGRAAPEASADWRALADRHIDFYAAELARGNPLRLPEDAGGRERAREYLQQVKGTERVYANILSNAKARFGEAIRLRDLVPNYAQVLNGPEGVAPVFSRAGWEYVEKASREGGPAILGEACVTGGASAMVSELKQSAETARAIQQMFLRDYIDQWRKFVEGFSVIRYTSAADAARKLEVLADHKSPLLAVLAMAANHTNFPPPAGPSDAGILRRGFDRLLGAGKKSAENSAATLLPTQEGSGFNTPADVTRYFQPVHWAEPPGSETWVVEKNAAYMEGLAQLRRSMQEIAQRGPNPDPAVHLAAGQNYEKALDAVRQIARGFKPAGVGGLDATVERLLEEPVRLSGAFIIRDVERAGAEKANRELRRFCAGVGNTLRKYPFQWSSSADASLEEFSAVFEPGRGAVWKFQQETLGEFTIKDGSQWRSKDAARTPQVTAEMLAFLNRAQTIGDIFFAGGSGTAQFAYSLRPRLDERLREFTLEIEVNGVPYQWTSSAPHTFRWPAPEGAQAAGAIARLRTATAGIPIASRGGVWGIFRILGDAEPRAMGSKVIEWRYTSAGVGRREPIQPAPVQAEIVEFPNNQDVFHPKFWETARCPTSAVK